MIKNNYILILVFLLLPYLCLAQFNAGGDTLLKPNFIGTIIKPKVEKRVQDYETQKENFALQYNPSTLKPIVFNEEVNRSFNTISLYAGNLNSINLKTALRFNKQKQSFTAFGAFDKAQATSIQKHQNINLGGMYVNNKIKKNIVLEGAYGNFTNYNYGKINTSLNNITSRNATQINLAASLTPKFDSANYILPSIQFQSFSLLRTQEQLFTLKCIFKQNLLKDLVWLTTPTYNLNSIENFDNSAFEIQSNLLGQSKNISYVIGAVLAHTNSKTYIQPNLELAVVSANKKAYLYGKYKSNLLQNSMQQLYATNGFMEVPNNFKNDFITSMALGLKYMIHQDITTGISFTQQKHSNYGTFKTDTPFNALNNTFLPNANLQFFTADVQYKLNDKQQLGIEVIKYNKSKEIYYLPDIKANIFAHWAFKSKWQFTPIVNYLGERIAGTDAGNNPLAVKPALDLSAHIDYSLTKRWHTSLKGNNLLNNNYYQWQGYNVYNTTVLLGLTFKNNP